MKKTLLILVFALLAPVALAQEKGIKPGFRDLKWRDPIPEGMAKKAGDEISAVYVREADKLSIGDVPLKKLTYGFFRGQFSSVHATTERGDALLRILTENWGKPDQPNEYIQSYLWTKGDTLAGYEINEITGSGELAVFSQSLIEATEKAKNERAAKAKTDL
jgi:hypothetical protein